MHIVHGELRKAPYVKTGCGQDGQSTMFIIELSEVIKDRQTGNKDYTNYSAAIFAKAGPQADYYQSTLVEGNFVVVTGEKLKVDVSDHNGKQYIKLQIEGARLEGSGYIQPQQQQGGYQQAPQQQGGFQQQAPQQAPQQQPPRPMDAAMRQNVAQNNQGGFAQQYPQDNTPPF